MAHKLPKTNFRVLTLQELIELCTRLTGSRTEAYSMGEKYGIGKRYVEVLRSLLGLAGEPTGYKLTEQQRKEIADDYLENHRSIMYYAEKYGITHNSVIKILKARRIYDGRTNLWTERQIMKFDMMVKQKRPRKEIAMVLGKTETAIHSRIRKMRMKQKKLENAA